MNPRYFEEIQLFDNLKNCHFYKNKLCFLNYIVLAEEVQIKDKKIEIFKN